MAAAASAPSCISRRVASRPCWFIPVEIVVNCIVALGATYGFGSLLANASGSRRLLRLDLLLLLGGALLGRGLSACSCSRCGTAAAASAGGGLLLTGVGERLGEGLAGRLRLLAGDALAEAAAAAGNVGGLSWGTLGRDGATVARDGDLEATNSPGWCACCHSRSSFASLYSCVKMHSSDCSFWRTT
jgi:hypothetical protein